MLIQQVSKESPRVKIQYDRVVTPAGNRIAQRTMDNVFKIVDAEWRGLGVIAKSGLAIKKDFAHFDSEKHFKIAQAKRQAGQKGCICGDVLRGLKEPKDCKLFLKACTPNTPSDRAWSLRKGPAAPGICIRIVIDI